MAWSIRVRSELTHLVSLARRCRRRWFQSRGCYRSSGILRMTEDITDQIDPCGDLESGISSTLRLTGNVAITQNSLEAYDKGDQEETNSELDCEPASPRDRKCNARVHIR